MRSTAFKIFAALYAVFFLGLLYIILRTNQADLHLDLTLHYIATCKPSWVSIQDVFFKYITELGSWVPFAAAIALMFYKVRTGVFILLAELLVAIVTRITKISFAAPRPKLFFATHFPEVELHRVDNVVMHSTNSFPSGHTATVFAFMLCLTLIFNKKTWLAPIFFLLAALASYSRIYLSQHFAEDILVGSLVGVSAAVIASIILSSTYHKKPRTLG
jgi:membrane-associated phospholipid phosphatase